MRLVFYSGGDAEDNYQLDLELLRLSGTGQPRITLIPASSDHVEEEVMDFNERFSSLGIKKLKLFQHDRPFTNYDAEQALDTDIVYLSGGNTFYFLHHLKKTGLLWKLKEFAEANGVMAGLSAGAIMMTSTIHTAAVPHFDRDENDLGVRNLRAMNLVNFEFFPHYDNSKRYIREFCDYTRERHRILYCCADGGGLIINHNTLTTVGWVWGFVRGQKLRLTQQFEDDEL